MGKFIHQTLQYFLLAEQKPNEKLFLTKYMFLAEMSLVDLVLF